MTHRFFYLVAIIAVSISFGTAHATTVELQRFDRPFYRQFVVSEAGQPVARVHRAKWRQIWRRNYSAYAADGQFLGSGHQPLSWSGMYWPSWSDIVFHDMNNEPVARLKGKLMTFMAASYELCDAQGGHLAQLVLDDHAQVVLITAAYGETDAMLLGQAVRIQQASGGRDSWLLAVDDALFPSEVKAAWPLVLAFFADSFDQLTRSEASR